MSEIETLVQEACTARERYLGLVADLDAASALRRPAPDAWNIAEITEHLVLAEQVGINGMWKALDGWRRETPVWSGDPVHRGRTIEEVVEQTWQPRETAPDVATPRWGGPLAYWVACLRTCEPLLRSLARSLEGAPLDDIIFPHPISGPLDARQRLAFLRFHLDHHRAQVESIVA